MYRPLVVPSPGRISILGVFGVTDFIGRRFSEAYWLMDGGAGGVLRAFGADDDVDDDDDDDDGDCERRSNTDGRGGKPGVVT